MEHFHHAGGVPSLLRELASFLDQDVMSISGQTIGEIIAHAEQVPHQSVIRCLSSPQKSEGAIAVLRGNLAPGTAVIKQSAASPSLCGILDEPSSSNRSKTWRSASICRVWMYNRRMCWFFAMPVPEALRGCRKPDICPFRQNSPARE